LSITTHTGTQPVRRPKAVIWLVFAAYAFVVALFGYYAGQYVPAFGEPAPPRLYVGLALFALTVVLAFNSTRMQVLCLIWVACATAGFLS
jgi:hypothetical protein